MNKKYKLTVTEKQANVIRKALEIYSRIGLGQFVEILYHPQWWLNVNDTEKVHKDIDNLIKSVCGFENSNMSYGIYSEEVDDTCRVAYDIEQVIRHRISWDNNPEGGFTVNFGKPMKTSKKEELPKIEENKEEN